MSTSTASLVIYSATHTAAAVTAALGLQPTSSSERGEPRTKHGLVHNRAHWRLDVHATGSGYASLEKLVDLLAGRDAALTELRRTYVTQLHWAGPAIPAPLVVRVAALGWDLMLERG